jgi:hypothetical protein
MESCKTPVDPKIKPDPKEKDLSGIPVRQPAPSSQPMNWQPGKLLGKKIRTRRTSLSIDKTSAKLTTVFSDVIG